MNGLTLKRLFVVATICCFLLSLGIPSVASGSSIPIFNAGGSRRVLTPTQSWEGTTIFSVSVIYDGGMFKAWYTAGTVQNNVALTSIGYATSNDGVSWTKYDKNPVFTHASGSAFDSVSVAYATVVKNGSQYSMHYRGWDGSESAIGLATSPDGTSWTRYPGSYIHLSGSQPNVILVNNQWMMYYLSSGGISLATSSDGVNWPTSQNIVLSPPGFTNAYAPMVVSSGGLFNMWFASDNSTGNRIFYASSKDGLTWTIYNTNPLPGVSNPDYPSVVTVGGTSYLWYSEGPSNSALAISLATTNMPIPEFGVGLGPVLATIMILLTLGLSKRNPPIRNKTDS